MLKPNLTSTSKRSATNHFFWKKVPSTFQATGKCPPKSMNWSTLYDFGTCSVCCELSEDEVDRALDAYFGRKATNNEIAHNYAHIALAGWCWYLWSLLKEAEGDFVGEWLYIYFNYGAKYLKKALEIYRKGE